MMTHAAVPPRDQTDRVSWYPNGWCLRGTAVALALAVSGMFGMVVAQPFGVLGVVTLIGAGLAWPTLLIGVWLSSAPAWRFARLDWCLWIMTVGSVVMAMGLCVYFVRIILWVELPNPKLFLLGGLFAADAAMGWVMTRYAPSVEISRITAGMLWIVGMNGFLLTILTLTYLTLTYLIIN